MLLCVAATPLLMGQFCGSPTPPADTGPADVAQDPVNQGDSATTTPPTVGGEAESPQATDSCPDDPTKTAPGICGCGVADADTDSDGTADCLDGCPEDSLKTDAGICGCGWPDFDLDGDLWPDLCLDNCPGIYNPDQADSNGDLIGDACEFPVIVGTYLVAHDGQFLGFVSTDRYATDSLANRYGTYGNRYSSLSIWNRYGKYGSNYESLSPWNAYTSTPPALVENNRIVGYVTANRFITPSIHPNYLAWLLGRTDAMR